MMLYNQDLYVLHNSYLVLNNVLVLDPTSEEQGGGGAGAILGGISGVLVIVGAIASVMVVIIWRYIMHIQ